MLKTISVGQLRPGMYVQRLHGPWLQHPYWRSSFLATDRDVERLLASEVETVEIDASRGEDVHAPAPAAVAVDAHVPASAARPAPAASGDPAADLDSELSRARRICREGRDAVEALFREVRLGRTIDPGAVMPLAEEITASVIRHPGALIGIARLKTADDYTYLHSVAVSALMAALARQMRLSEDECRQAAMGGLLHDMGKARMPPEILNKPARLTDEEFALMRTHPEEGERLLRESGMDNASVLHMVRHHHEKFDGGGYPERLPAEAIPLLTRMSAVCDVYDAVTSNRPYKEGWDPGESLRRMASWKGHFDPAVLKAFVATVGIYPIGTLVRLSSDRLAVVLEQRGTALSSPLVRVFFSARSRSQILVHDVDLSAAGCPERIVGLESPRQWGFRDLEKLWAP
ncbi:phosphodiesterase [Pseudoxanthomonas broegbernensis]|uniref:Phosphodiesterase n=1 Tax=Pseudoxanthomonas broegbernensis TaxID=83619 RepID=A0A7V8K7F8_9GAMM|nr:HD-GYP domain-containing protein [Pseudoxanthomonas broegbernensis]KAF1687147.1 phosphodiesterase [Pseudoxanthomonas broegbernensis]MBB6065875.1 putative nucleotidyltransferase with HDIG domain [Pseudoxanthomonas broegbernensis]